MPYLPEAQHTPWQQSEEVDLTRTAVLVIDGLAAAAGWFLVLRAWRKTQCAL